MFRSALRELKYHPARYIATLVAIAISVCFMAASSIITKTESNAMALQAASPYMKADAILQFGRIKSADGLTIQQMADVIESVPGVTAAEPLWVSFYQVEHDSTVEFVSVSSIPTDEGFVTVDIKEGELPHGAEIAINSALASMLDVGVGDTVEMNGEPMTVSGITTDPAGRLFGNPGYVGSDWIMQFYADSAAINADWLIKADTSPAQIEEAVTASLTDLGVQMDIEVESQGAFMDRAAASWTQDVDVLKYILWVFAGIAMLVGLITISNTFAILLAQRRRQTGLMRAIGASATQVRRSVWGEALALGVTGSVGGVALACGLSALLGLYTSSIHFGLQIPLMETLIAFTLGVVITFIACVAPARKATKVPPIEALQPAASGTSTHRVSVARAVICSLFILAGIAGVILVFNSSDSLVMVIAVASAMSLAIGVLFGSRLFVPWVLRGLGALVKFPTGRIAAKNVVRDPARASATATALMLAVGLIITLQVGAASVKETVLSKIAEEYPVDVIVQAFGDGNGDAVIPSHIRSELEKVRGVDKTLMISCKDVYSSVEQDHNNLGRICGYSPEMADVTTLDDSTIPSGEIWVGEYATNSTGSPISGTTITLPGVSGDMPLLAKEVSVASGGSYSFVSPETYDAIAGDNVDDVMMFISMREGTSVITFMNDINKVAAEDSQSVFVGGFLVEKYLIEQVMSVLVGVVTVLLGVAVVIALVGVGNTLTLSVIERSRESAILRAVGAQRKQLRAMILVEALLLTVTGALVGLGAGSFFGWLGAVAMVQQFRADGIVMPVHFALDWVQTLGLLAVLVVATVLASVLPGRRAAKASPVEALADV